MVVVKARRAGQEFRALLALGLAIEALFLLLVHTKRTFLKTEIWYRTCCITEVGLALRTRQTLGGGVYASRTAKGVAWVTCPL